MDDKCPNAALHRAAGALSSPGPDSQKQNHVLTVHDVLAGTGYTFVAKGVQYQHRRVLQHEAGIYSALNTFQGRLVPVCLGVVELGCDIPLHSCACVSHLMLMSHAGCDLCTALPKGWDWRTETERTWNELQAAGLFDEDQHSQNTAWNPEANWVMQFDFDQASFSGPPTATPAREPTAAPTEAPADAPVAPAVQLAMQQPTAVNTTAVAGRQTSSSSPPCLQSAETVRSPLQAKGDLNMYQKDDGNQQDNGDQQPTKRLREALGSPCQEA
ncbi:hypothetical protein SCUCBS95973_001510 [Sporothrix curviconia]|uniref:Uncharacterized protein n=1 Tax=Sporothrix curviconia TaxID=1260050 RepID=A0ABP0AZB2_9PEZI